MNLRILAFPLAACLLCACAARSPRALPELANLSAPAPGMYASGQPKAEEFAALKASGVKQIIDLRPDAETPELDEAAAARAAKLRYENLPIAGADDLTRENVIAFDHLLAQAEQPALVHCASSNRVGALIALRATWLQGRSVEDALEEGRRWGLKSLEPVVREKMGAVVTD